MSFQEVRSGFGWLGDESAKCIVRALLERITKCEFVKYFVLWTSVSDLVDLARTLDIHHLPRRTYEKQTGLPHDLPMAWKNELTGQLHQAIGTTGNIQLFLDVAQVLIRRETVERLYDRLMEDGQTHKVVAAYPIDPHLFLDQNGKLEQIWAHPGVDRQLLPQLYRECGVYAAHGLRPQWAWENVSLLEIDWIEGMPYRAGYTDFILEQAGIR